MSSTGTDVIVVGAGLSGLTAAALLFGFGDKGFAPHRFVMNELEEPVEVVRHKALYRLNYGERQVVFWPELPRRPEPRDPPGTASLCQWCETPPCHAACPARIDIRGALRRMEMGNYPGAYRCVMETEDASSPVPIAANLSWLVRNCVAKVQ